jgi:hypothetical protein
MQAINLAATGRGPVQRPVAEVETHLLLIERQGTPNTGDRATAAVRREI